MHSFARELRSFALALALAGTLTACGSSSSSTPKAGSDDATRTAHISITMFSYDPATLTVTPGTRVTFTNRDQTAHTATGTRPGLDTGTIRPGHSVTVTLRSPGTYPYYCQFHAFMRGTIVVR